MGPFISLVKEETPSILVVDDVQSNLELMEAVFLKEGYSVYTAGESNAAIDLFRQYPIDLAVLDVMMPGLDGFELCRKLKDITGKRFFSCDNPYSPDRPKKQNKRPVYFTI